MGKYVIIRKIRSIDRFGDEIAVCDASNGEIIKSFGDDTDNEFVIAKKFCQDEGYIIVDDFTVDNLIVSKSTIAKTPKTEKTFTIDQLLEAYKDYALEQMKGGEADIDMLDKFFNNYLHIDTTEAYETALDIHNSV